MYGFVCLFLALTGAHSAAPPLPKFHIIGNLTVSGISSGAGFAVQISVAFSSSVRGAGIAAGVPYWCAHGINEHSENCTKATLPLLYNYTNTQAKEHHIDNPTNLKRTSVVLWSGERDTVVPQHLMDVVRAYYQHYGSTVKAFFHHAAEHGWPTNFWGNPCPVLKPPYVINCDFDFAGYILHTFYREKWNSTRGHYNKANLLPFNQKPFKVKANATSLADTGYLYVPRQCHTGACKLHVSFHGCTMNVHRVGFAFIEHTGLNEWAESNDIIVLYPQVDYPGRADCWDQYGWTGKNYALKSGKQMAFVHAVVNAMGGNMQ